MRRRLVRNTLLFCSALAGALALLASGGSAETAVNTPGAKPTMTDEALVFIQSQRSYVYKWDSRDVFGSIFVFVTVPPTPTPGATPKLTPTATDSPAETAKRLKQAAEAEAATVEKKMSALVGQKKYDEAIALKAEFEEKYKALPREDLAAVEARFLAAYGKAVETKKLVDGFQAFCANIKVSAILWSERTQAANINGIIFNKGDLLDKIFPDGPRDFKVIDITPNSVVVGSAELGLTHTIQFSATAARAN